MKKVAIIILLFNIIIPATLAAGADVYFSEDVIIHLDDLNNDFTVKAGSQVEEIIIGGSYITVTMAQDSAFTIESADRLNFNPSAGTAVCPADNASASYFSKSGAGNITLSPSASQCVVSGGSVPIITSGGGGGGGGSSTITNLQSSQVTSDGTKVQTITTDINNEPELESTIDPADAPSDSQNISLNTASTAEVREVKVSLSSEIIKELSGQLGDGEKIYVGVKSHEAAIEQKTTEARDGMYMIGFDVFTIDISAGDKKISQLGAPVFLSFDISNISEPENLKVYYFNTSADKWQQVGDGGSLSNGKLVVAVEHFTDFTIMKEIKSTSVAEVVTNPNIQWQSILDEASILAAGSSEGILSINNLTVRDSVLEASNMNKYVVGLISNKSGITDDIKSNLIDFVTYGTPTTKKLGAGERAGIINSFKAAYGKIPQTVDEWRDCVAIGNGRWPNVKSLSSENNASKEFKKIYLREPDRNSSHDNAAVTVIAYGLRPSQRNLDSEKAAIVSFKYIYGHAPRSATAWDIVRAIAYSGAKR